MISLLNSLYVTFFFLEPLEAEVLSRNFSALNSTKLMGCFDVFYEDMGCPTWPNKNTSCSWNFPTAEFFFEKIGWLVTGSNITLNTCVKMMI